MTGSYKSASLWPPWLPVMDRNMALSTVGIFAFRRGSQLQRYTTTVFYVRYVMPESSCHGGLLGLKVQSYSSSNPFFMATGAGLLGGSKMVL